MFLLTTRPIDDALSDCKLLNRKNINAVASPSMKIFQNSIKLNSIYDGIFLTSRHAAHVIKFIEDKKTPVFCVGSSTAKLARMYGAENLIVGKSDALFLANKVKCYLPKNSKILWPSNNTLKDSIYIDLENNVYNVNKKQTYSALPLKELDINSTNLILNKQVLIVLFFSLKSTEMWIELINKANLFKFLNNINFIGINEKIVNYLCDLSLNKVLLSRRKRRASVLSLGMKVFNNMEKSL